jgi:hypothetical protein
MTRYRIYTENKDRVYIEHLLNQCFDGFTVYKTKGQWKGKAENSLVFEIIEDGGGLHALRNIAREIKAHNNQDAVLVTRETISGGLI